MAEAETQSLPQAPERYSIEWQALEYEHREKTPDWFWVIGIGGGVLALLALIFKNFFLAIIFILASFTMILYGKRPPALMNFALTPKGVRLGERLYPYDFLKSFWVDDEKGEDKRKIIIESQKLLMPHLILPLIPEIDVDETRHYLAAFLKEERHDDTLADVVGDILGF